MSQQPQDSPHRASHHSHQSNVAARHAHTIANRAIKSRNMDGYTRHVRDQFKAMLSKGKSLRRSDAATLLWNDVVADVEVVQAHAALVAVVRSTTETEHYGPTTHLLNRISKALYKALNLTGKYHTAFIFASGPHTRPTGDFLGTLFEPDYISYRGHVGDLDRALTNLDFRQAMAWPEIDSVGEQKVPTNADDGMPQLKSYMVTLKRYRPDIPTVRGFKVHAGQVMLAELNACGMWTSYPVDCEKLDPWVAYVAGLYIALASRDQKLDYDATQGHFVQWNVMAVKRFDLRQVDYAIAPFYVARAPGRITFASFQISQGAIDKDRGDRAFFIDDVLGFWKLSWQQTNARSNEKQLLRSLHKNGWLPGLVRLHDDDDKHLGKPLVVPTLVDYEGGAAKDSRAEVDSASASQPRSTVAESAVVARAQDIVRLASIGEPLSQCGSLRELLYTFYDLLETLIHMWHEDDEDEGVLHRDVSWFNVLYNPLHLTSEDKRKVLKRPCITEIMHKLTCSLEQDGVDIDGRADQATADAGNAAPRFSPRVLLTDLDHAIEKRLLKENPNVGREKTGTPMFMSVELSDYKSMKYEPFLPVQKVFFALLAIEELPQGPLALQHAFPDGDKGFMTKFEAVMAMETNRRAALRLNSRPRHRPRHDAESSFWVFLWAAVRALPLDAMQEGDLGERDLNEFSKFCDAMLKHVVSDETSDDRSVFLEHRGHLRGLFHPAFAEVYDLYDNMAAYLSIPWHHYEQLNMVDDNHVHVAFRRLLLHFFLTVDPVMVDIALDTSQPRFIMISNPEDSKERKETTPASALAQLRASNRETPLSSLIATGDSKPGTKRKAEDDDPADRGTGPSKKAATTTTRKKATPPHGQDAEFAPAPDPPSPSSGPPPNYGAMAREEYNSDRHAHSWSAHALRLKFWKDRQLWFSKGKKSPSAPVAPGP